MTRKVVLVTGATGLIGWPTMPHFADLGVQAVGLARRGTAGVIACDLFDTARLRDVLAEVRPSHILHLAWDVTPGQFVHGSSNLDYVAVTMGLARAAAAAGVTRFVGVGTCAEYDWSDGGAAPRRETDTVAPEAIYGIAKDATRRILEAFFRKEGIGFAWARPFHLFGAGESPLRLVGGLVDALRHDRPFTCRHGQLVRDFISTIDAGEALARLVAGDVAGPVNIASGEVFTLAGLAAFVADRMGKRSLLELQYEPAPRQPLTMLGDVTRLRQEVGFTPALTVSDRLAALLD
jgi:nucleoside-diphosphate-sugar epimerase